MRFMRIGAVACTAAVIVVAAAVPAAANADSRTCSADGHFLNATWTYDLTSTQHIWRFIDVRLSGAGTGGKSNVFVQMRDNGNLIFNDEVPPHDDLDNGPTYRLNFPNFSTLRSHNEVWTARAVFDEFGGDDSCTATLDL